MPIQLTQKGNASLVSQICRLSHPAIAAPKRMKGDTTSEPKYGASLIFEPADTADIWEAILAVANAKWVPIQLADGQMLNAQGMLTGMLPNGQRIAPILHTPLRSGAERPTDKAYVNKFFINSSSKTQPQLLGVDGVTVLRPEAFYAGCYVRAFLGVFAFDVTTKKGIGIGLNALQFVRDGERIDGQGDARAAFAQAGAIPQPAPQQGSGYNGGGAMPPQAPAAGQPGWQPPANQQPAYAAPAGQPVQGAPSYPPAGGPAGYAPPAAAAAPGVALPPGVG